MEIYSYHEEKSLITNGLKNIGLEVEYMTDELRATVFDAVYEDLESDFFRGEEDSSVDIEFVLENPIQEHELKAMFYDLEEINEFMQNFYLVEDKEVGVHIHLDLNWFDNPRHTSLFKLLMNYVFIRDLGWKYFKRGVNDYCRRQISYNHYHDIKHYRLRNYQALQGLSKWNEEDTRYLVCNNTTKTMEVRCFRNTYKVEDIKRYFELLFFTVEYSREMMRNPMQETHKALIRYMVKLEELF